MNFDFEQMFRHVPTNIKREDHRPTSTMYLFHLHSLLVKINKEIIEISVRWQCHLLRKSCNIHLLRVDRECGGIPRSCGAGGLEPWSNVRFIDSGFVDGQILDNIIQLQRNILFPGQIYDLRFLIPGEKDTGL